MCRDSKFQSHALETMLSIQKDKRYQVFDRVVGFHVGTYLSELELSKQLLFEGYLSLLLVTFWKDFQYFMVHLRNLSRSKLKTLSNVV